MDEQLKAHYVLPMAKEDEMSVEVILSEIPEEDLHEVGIVQGRIFMPASFARKWVLPTLRVRKALAVYEDKSQPGGIETAMLFSIFDQSVIDFTRPSSELSADDSAIRAIVAYATDDTTVKLIPRMRQGNTGLTKGALDSLKELKDVCQLPKAAELWKKQDGRIVERKDEIYMRLLKRSSSMKVILEEILVICNC